MTTQGEDTPFSSSIDYAKYGQYLAKYLRVQDGEVRDLYEYYANLAPNLVVGRDGTLDVSYRYEYRYVGDLFLGDYLYNAAGDLLPCFADAAGLQEASKADESKKERRWCPVILCILHPSDGQVPFITNALVVFEKDIPEHWYINGGLDGDVCDGIVYFTGILGKSAELTSIFSVIEQNGLDQELLPKETKSILQSNMARLEQLDPYMIDNHILTEGWCNLRADSKSDHNMFVFF